MGWNGGWVVSAASLAVFSSFGFSWLLGGGVLTSCFSGSTVLLFDEQAKRRAMLADKIEVCDWLVDLIENYPRSLQKAGRGDFRDFVISCAE